MSSEAATAARPASGAPVVLVCPLDAPIRAARYRALVTASELERIDTVVRPPARDRALVGRALLRLELAERLGCRPEAVRFTFGPAGKPALAGGDQWHFNLSHSGDRVVLALAPRAPVGVDVENRARRARIDDLARHYFDAAECAELDALAASARRYHFFRQWTVKEAVTKALGASLWSTLSGIRLTRAGTQHPRLELAGAAACSTPLAWWHFDLGAGYSLALAQLAGSREAPVIQRVIPGETRDPWPLQPDSGGVSHASD